MNMLQKTVIALGALLVALRAAFPVKYAELPGFRIEGGDFPEFMQKVDWGVTGLHMAGSYCCSPSRLRLGIERLGPILGRGAYAHP